MLEKNKQKKKKIVKMKNKILLRELYYKSVNRIPCLRFFQIPISLV